MRTIKIPAIAVLAIDIVCSSSWAQPPGIVHLMYPTPITVSGIAVDAAGEPVQGVRIQHIAVRGPVAIMEVSVETDPTGRFQFETLAPAVVFRKDGFESQLVRIPSQRTELHIVLKSASTAEAIPTCRPHSGCVSVGEAFCFPKVKGVYRGEAEHTIDTVERLFIVRRRRQMIHGAGPSWDTQSPGGREVWSSSTYIESIRKGDGIEVMDARGTTLNGKVWRHVGVRGESASYADLDADAAAIMDRVLDGLCLIKK